MSILQSLCLYYDLYVYTTISMSILRSLCLYYDFYVNTMISMSILRSLCQYYDLYVYTTISMNEPGCEPCGPRWRTWRSRRTSTCPCWQDRWWSSPWKTRIRWRKFFVDRAKLINYSSGQSDKAPTIIIEVSRVVNISNLVERTTLKL